MRLLLALLLLTTAPLLAASPVIRIAVIDWCPQLCPQQEREGYILDLVREVYRPTEYRLQLDVYPWSRALAMVRQGKVDAVLSPARAEAPDLRFPRQEVGVQRMCFLSAEAMTGIIRHRRILRASSSGSPGIPRLKS